MSLFYYVTYKLVLLKDKRLGVLYYVLATLAFLYTVMEIFIKKGYMNFDTNPHGTIKLILSDDFADEAFLAEEDLAYCKGDTPCYYLDPWDLNWPSESRAVTITTFAKDRIQERVSLSNGQRDEFNTTKEKVYFTQTPDQVVIKVEHAVVASLFTDALGRQRLAASHRQLKGYLVDRDGSIVRTVSTGQGKADRLTLKELLLAAGVRDLDEPSDIVDARGRSLRQRGCILKVTIFYQNWMAVWIGASMWGCKTLVSLNFTRSHMQPLSAIDYRYQVQRMPYVDYSTKQVEPLLSEEEVLKEGGVHQARWRLQRKRYSVRVEFEQAGILGMFSLPTLLFKLVSGAALFTLIATITDTLALYLLPNKNTYRSVVYGDSGDQESKPLVKQKQEKQEKQE